MAWVVFATDSLAEQEDPALAQNIKTSFEGIFDILYYI